MLFYVLAGALIIVTCLIACFLATGVNYYLNQKSRQRWLGLSMPADVSVGWQLVEWLINTFALPFRDVEKKMIRAGIYNQALAKVYFPAKLGAALVISTMVLLFGRFVELDTPQKQFIALLCTSVVIIVGPDIWLAWRQKRRMAHICERLPYLLDLMAVCVQTGMTIEATIEYLAKELKGFDRDLAYLMRRAASVLRVSGTDQALEDLGGQLPSREMQRFVHTLQQSIRYGNSLVDALTTQADNLRKVFMLTMEERVAKLSAKMSVPLILLIMFPLVILMTAPGIMRMMSHG